MKIFSTILTSTTLLLLNTPAFSSSMKNLDLNALTRKRPFVDRLLDDPSAVLLGVLVVIGLLILVFLLNRHGDRKNMD